MSTARWMGCTYLPLAHSMLTPCTLYPRKSSRIRHLVKNELNLKGWRHDLLHIQEIKTDAQVQ